MKNLGKSTHDNKASDVLVFHLHVAQWLCCVYKIAGSHLQQCLCYLNIFFCHFVIGKKYIKNIIQIESKQLQTGIGMYLFSRQSQRKSKIYLFKKGGEGHIRIFKQSILLNISHTICMHPGKASKYSQIYPFAVVACKQFAQRLITSKGQIVGGHSFFLSSPVPWLDNSHFSLGSSSPILCWTSQNM